MKRISLLILFFYSVSFANPPQVKAALPLAILVPATIGAAVIAIGGTQIALKNPSPGMGFDGHSLTKDLVGYAKVAMAGGEYLLGKGYTAALDAVKAAEGNALDGYYYLKNAIADYLSANTSADPSINDIVDDYASCGWSGNSKVYNKTVGVTLRDGPYDDVQCWPGGMHKWETIGPQGGGSLYWEIRVTSIYVQTTTEDVNWQPVPPVVTPGNAPEVAEHLYQNKTQEMENELEELLKNRPDLFSISPAEAVPAQPGSIEDYPPALPISGTEINQWAQAKGADAQQSYIDTLQGLVDANPTDANLAAQLAKAKAEQAQQEAEDVQDSFDAIHSNPFETPYTPGQFDIPARFSSFLNNVQGSGLFSFSSSFFNSLPGDGSPVYTIEAGQYGTHTVDLSETLSSGLAVLKTVLLLLFGFLSIRVVILKR